MPASFASVRAVHPPPHPAAYGELVALFRGENTAHRQPLLQTMDLQPGLDVADPARHLAHPVHRRLVLHHLPLQLVTGTHEILLHLDRLLATLFPQALEASLLIIGQLESVHPVATPRHHAGWSPGGRRGIARSRRGFGERQTRSCDEKHTQ
ncbi:MAG: hypothetical protein V1774_05215 [Candidatus Eisenbacteria bacterium]